MATIAQNAPFHEEKQGTGVTGSVVTLTFDTVPTGRFRRYERIGYINETNATTKVRAVVKGGASDHIIDEENTLTANRFYWDPDGFTLTENEYLVMQFTGSTTSDVLRGYTRGYEGDLGDL